jgi:quercetin dioxygenase-like cupin family protein
MWNIIATRQRLLLLALCGVALFAAAAYALTVENVAFGTIAFFEPLHGPADVSIDRITLDPGDPVPWHYHGGDAYGVVKTGTLTFIDGCGDVSQYSAGEAFFERAGQVHTIANEEAVPVEFFGVIVACSGSPLTTIVAGPLCAPTSAEQCKNGGWTRFNNPVFKSQGECVTFAQHPKPPCK